MTSRDTPTKAPASTPAGQKSRTIQTAAPQTRDEQRPPDPRPTSSWLIWVAIAAALAAAIWLVIAGMANEYEAARSLRSDQAYSARLQGLADKYEADRRTRSDQAYSARLQGLADKYEADRLEPSVDPAG